MLVTALAMALVFGEGQASGVADPIGVDVAWVELLWLAVLSINKLSLAICGRNDMPSVVNACFIVTV